MFIGNEKAWGHLQTRFAEWQNGMILFSWGLYVSLNPYLFLTPPNNQWGTLLMYGPQSMWGAVGTIVGGIRLGALYVNGRRKITPSIRLAMSVLSALVMGQLVLGLLRSGMPSTGLCVYPFLLLGDIYSAYRAGADTTFVAKATKRVENGRGERVA